MCLAIPGKILRIDEQTSIPRFADVDSGGLVRRICVDFLPDAAVGEYVLVHVGYALEKINQKDADEQLDAFKVAEELIRGKMK
jgi:hydrogenase expression/formation protein HypC